MGGPYQCGLNCVGMPNQDTQSSRIAFDSSAGASTLSGSVEYRLSLRHGAVVLRVSCSRPADDD